MFARLWVGQLLEVNQCLIIASGIAVLFDAFEYGGTGQAIATIPEFLWELSLGLYLTFKGFMPSPILSDDRSSPWTNARRV